MNSKEKLYKAAVELISQQGYEKTTVQEIAAKAGVTERTFFRQFKDKSDMLFDGSESWQHKILAEMELSNLTNPVEKVVRACQKTSAIFDDRHEHSALRHEIIQKNPDLRERELLKMANLTAAITENLKQNYPTEIAELAARISVPIFSQAFQEWVQSAELRNLADILDEVFERYNKIHQI